MQRLLPIVFDDKALSGVFKLIILGEIVSERFYFGVSKMPLVFSDVNIISQNDLRIMLEVTDDETVVDKENGKTRAELLKLGTSVIFPDYSVKVNIDKFFGFHFAVFGNTGAGKSNTIATIMQEIFRKKDYAAKGAKFVFIDSNGEYEQAFSKISSINPALSVKSFVATDNTDDPHHLEIPAWALTADDWAILLHATEKTQVPILKRAVDIARIFFDENSTDDAVKNHILAIDNNGNKLFKNRITHLVEMSWDERHTMQKELYKLVTAYVSKTYNKAQRNRKKNMCLICLLIIMQRMVTSSTTAVRQSLERRLDILKSQSTRIGSLTEEDLAELDIEDGVEEALEAISLDLDEEIAELENIISIAKQAEFQHPDVKIEHLLNTIDEIIGEDRDQKIIIFTEFVATQQYLERILTSNGYTVSTLNGSMTIDERNLALKDFRDCANIFISTDAGGEGLNLQFSNIIINYDLPWNPMKIEQRCGRADRIGQKRDVHIYNFIIGDTVENRVRQVLEEKLSVIFKEMGVDKYSDVLDSEVAECDFTDVYMRSISHPSKIAESLYPVEAEMKQQLANAKKYKDVIREEKDLTTLVGSESDFDVEEALRMVLTYYDRWQGEQLSLFDRIGINDEKVTKHLNVDIMQDRFSPIL